MSEEILQTYKKFNYPSVGKLYQLLKGKYKTKEIEEAVKPSTVRQIFYDRKPRPLGRILAFAPNQKWQCDISFLDKFGTTNKNYKYLLLVVDVFSRYAWAIPLKTKNISEVVDAFETIKAKPQILTSDNGSEFVGKQFQDILEKKEISHITTILDDHHALGIIDRLTRTLKNNIYKHFIADNNTHWYDKIDTIMKTYNDSPHRGIYGYTPSQAMNDEDTIGVITTANLQLSRESMKNKEEVKEGDSVRVKVRKDKFTRGYNPKWSSNIEKVEKVVGNTVYVDGKRYKIVDIQVVPHTIQEEEPGKELKKAIKEDKVKRVLNIEGVNDDNVRPKRERVIKFDKSLVGKRINRGDGETGTITKYEEDGPFHWYVKYDTKAKMKSEWMNESEVKQFLVK